MSLGVYGDRLRELRVEASDRRRNLLDAVRAGSKFVADADFQAAGVGATAAFGPSPRSVDEWRGRHGRTVRFRAGDDVGADMVQRLVAVHGLDIPVRVVPPEPTDG